MYKWKILNVTLLQSYNVTFGIMRAKEYIAQNADSIGHLAEVSQALADLTPLRLDKQATDEYLNDDLNYQQYDRLTSDGYRYSETCYNA